MFWAVTRTQQGCASERRSTITSQSEGAACRRVRSSGSCRRRVAASCSRRMCPVIVMAAGGRVLLVSLLLLLSGPGLARGWDQPGRVLLREVQALTFYRDQYTTSRRTSPIPQLQCTGGTAGCAYVPMVVQCHNKGWDGFDIQWECKADLDNSYRFGRIEVSCEGYDYPDDPYILRGSCGLQYGLELTEEGQRKANNFGGSFGSSYYQSSKVNSQDSSNSFAGVIVVIVLLLLAYGCYKLFLGNQLPQQDFSNGDGYSGTSWQNTQTPPPPGFKSSFTAGGFGGSSSSEANLGRGFWTGLGTGGLLGYLAGSQRSQPHSSYFPNVNPYAGPTTPPPPSRNSSGFTGPHPSGTRTASGFGGTKRR
ncbi:store-operated calcium entry-associated regulatory factor isoform X2 [Mauremys reevesii]|uniref:store-operated calcium entry-associated regulatory factor isoform X2 n=1 Tax=Mauremys reevesii TaxID=260615 RepID=UPI00193F73C7|nr:store-operated calcium entry-associated regulatory factor isoform X2 [Mauremys reevesii]